MEVSQPRQRLRSWHTFTSALSAAKGPSARKAGMPHLQPLQPVPRGAEHESQGCLRCPGLVYAGALNKLACVPLAASFQQCELLNPSNWERSWVLPSAPRPRCCPLSGSDLAALKPDVGCRETQVHFPLGCTFNQRPLSSFGLLCVLLRSVHVYLRCDFMSGFPFSQ